MLKEKDKPFSEMGVMEKARFMLRNVTVEPLVLAYVVPIVFASLANQNLNLEKACRVNLGYEAAVCDALTRRDTARYGREEAEVQRLVAGMTVWMSLIKGLIPSVLVLFLGSLSDRRKQRKPFMLAPIVGEFLCNCGLMLCTFFFYELSMEVAGLAEALLPAVTGSGVSFFMAASTYVGDITSVADRTVRLGFVSVMVTAGYPLGSALSGVLLQQFGFYGVFSIAITLFLLAFFYGLLYLDESLTPNRPRSCERDGGAVVAGGLCGGGLVGFLKDLFYLGHIKKSLVVAFKDGANNRRQRVLMLMVVVMVVVGPLHGEMTVMYLFTRYRFNWNEVDYSIFSTYSMMTNLIGTLVSVGVFSHMLKIDDALIGVMSCMSKILAGFVYAYAKTDWQIYLAPLVDIVNGTSFIAMRSIASKLVPPEELGKINSLFGVCEALMPLVYGPMYSAVYAATMDTMPGAFFLLGGALTFPAVLIFGWMYTEHLKDRRQGMDASGKMSKKEEALRSMRVDSVATTPSHLGGPGHDNLVDKLGAQDNGRIGGLDNPGFQEDKTDSRPAV